jgi:hypothetical protein
VRAAALALLLSLPAFAQQTRIASDFEIAQMEQQVARSKDFVSQLSGRLNLGDLRMTRNEPALARAEYQRAAGIAAKERLDARRASEMTRYATATSYAALAAGKLGDDTRAFALAEEALRYTSDSAKTWNLYASTMDLLRQRPKAASAARNAVAIAERDLQREPSVANRLDLNIYRYALASDVSETEAEPLLRDVVASLRSNAFESLKSEAARRESFEIYSSARGDVAAYVSLLNRSQLRLASLYESRGDAARAREQYQNVLVSRSDDPTALAALARLARSNEERERYYDDAFDANPFSIALIRDYQRYLRGKRVAIEGTSTGAQVRRAVAAIAAGESRSARTTLDALLQKFPDNDALKMLRRESEREPENPLRALIARFNDDRVTPEERAELDRNPRTSVALFNAGTPAPAGQTIFETGTIDGVPFRFSEPIAFAGTFAPQTPLRLTYKILGATRVGEMDALLLEPVKLQ